MVLKAWAQLGLKLRYARFVPPFVGMNSVVVVVGVDVRVGYFVMLCVILLFDSFASIYMTINVCMRFWFCWWIGLECGGS